MPDFRVLFEAIPGSYLVLAPDPDFTIVAVSDAYLRATMTHRNAIVGKPLFEVFPDNPDDPQASGTSNLRASILRALDGKRADIMPVQKYDIRRPPEEGGGFEERFWSPVNSPVLAPDGTVAYLIHRVEDVTDYIRMKQQGTELRGVAESLEGSYRHLQAQLGRLHLLHKIAKAIGERQDLQSILQVVVHSLEDSLPVDLACICLSEEGSDRLHVAAVGTKGASLAPGILLLEPQASLDPRVAKWLGDGLTEEPDISAVHDGFAGYLAHAGLHALVCVPLRVERKTIGLLIVARRAVRSFSAGEDEFLRQLAEQLALAAHQAALYRSLQRAYDDLRDTQRALLQQERLRAVGSMASGIAHDINNAISPITLYTGLLLDKFDLPANVREYIALIQRAGEGVGRTIERMRAFYRPREEQAQHTPVDLARLVGEVIELTRVRWSTMPAERGIVIDLGTDIDAATPRIIGDDQELRDALTNLIFNAVDAMPRGGALRVRCQRAPGRMNGPQSVLLEVTDSGVGMDAKTRARCLEPFFTTKGEGGTGLGLAMVYGMAQRHGADLSIDSEPGSGTSVRIVFKLLEPVSSDATTVRRAALVVRQLRILIVDDDPLVSEALGAALREEGHTIAHAAGGQAGIDAFAAALGANQPFDVVVTDLGMPYVDGRIVAAAVKERSPSTHVIMLTGWWQNARDDRETTAHVDRVLGKPPRMRELRAALIELTQSAPAAVESPA